LLPGRSKWGEPDYEDTVDGFKDMLGENSNEDEYLDDGPGKAYQAIPYDITTALLKIEERKWGEVAEEDTPGYLKNMIAGNSNSDEYKHDEPKGYQTLAHPVEKSNLQVSPTEAVPGRSKWGVVEYEDTFDWVKDMISDHSNEEDYVGAAPKTVGVTFDPIAL